jgi:hypothetical protein
VECKHSGHPDCPADCNIVNAVTSLDILASPWLEHVCLWYTCRVLCREAEVLDDFDLGSSGYVSFMLSMFDGPTENHLINSQTAL